MKLPPLPKTSWLTRLGLGLTSALVLIASLAIASFLFVGLLIIGLLAAGWLWWQYRKLVRHAQQAQPTIIEGDYVIEPTPPALPDQREPAAVPSADPVKPTAHRAS